MNFTCSKKIIRIYRIYMMVSSLDGASVLMTNFWIFCEKDSFKDVVLTIFTKVHWKVTQLTQILLTLSLDILYKSHQTNLNKEAAIKHGNSHLEISRNRRSFNLTRDWQRTLSNFITCSRVTIKKKKCIKGEVVVEVRYPDKFYLTFVLRTPSK